MIRHLVAICSIYLSLVLQSSVIIELPFVAFHPWLPGMAVVACALFSDGSTGLVLAAFLGLAIDCQATDQLGVNLAAATIVASGMMATRSDNKSLGMFLIVIDVLGATFVWRVFVSIVHGLLDRQQLDFARVTANGLRQAISTGVLTIILLLAHRIVLNPFRLKSISSVTLGNRWSMLTDNE